MLVWPYVTYGRKINWKLTYRAIASCVCVGYLLTFLILYGSRAAMLPGSWIWGGWLTYLVLVPLRPIMTIILHPSLTSHQPDLHTTGGFSSLSRGVSALWQNFMVLCNLLSRHYAIQPAPSIMIFTSETHLHVYLLWIIARLAWCLDSVLNVKALVGAFNQEKALVGPSSWLYNLIINRLQH